MTTGQHHPTIRPATGPDLDALQALARRTIDTCYRGFLGDEAVDWFVGSGASDEHVRGHLEQGHVHCLDLETFPDNVTARSFYDSCGWVLGDRLEGEGPAKLEYTKSAGD
ncbi:hypothetical protein [Nocardia sp. NPDC004415]